MSSEVPPTEPLDRSSPLPLWAQLEERLQDRLKRGEFAERFPTDKELVETYGVSRHTVREAIRHLNQAGVLKRERGRGTVVNTAEFEQGLGTLYSLFASIESAGVEQRSQVLDIRISTDSVAASHLQVPADTEFFFLERIRFAGDAPLAVDRVWLGIELGRPLLDVDFSHTAVYDELERSGASRPNKGWERITPIVPPAADRERLGLRKSDAAFFLERLGMLDEDRIEWRTTTIRGDRYRFVTDWSSSSKSPLELRTAH